MKANLLKRLFSAVQQGSDDVMSVCKHIVDDEKRLGHSKLAAIWKSLSKLLKSANHN